MKIQMIYKWKLGLKKVKIAGEKDQKLQKKKEKEKKMIGNRTS